MLHVSCVILFRYWYCARYCNFFFDYRKKKKRDPNTPRRPPGRPPKDPSKLEAYKLAQEALEKADLEEGGGDAANSQTVKEEKEDTNQEMEIDPSSK